MNEFVYPFFTSPRYVGDVLRSVCLSVCLSACLLVRSHMLKTTVQISTYFLYMLPVAVARSSSDGNAIRYVLPVLSMTPCFQIMDRTDQNRRRRLFRLVRQVAAPGAKPTISDCIFFVNMM